MTDEARYQEVTIALMLSVAKMDTFPDLAKHEDADRLIAQAQAAVAEVRRWTERHQEIRDVHAAYARTIAAEAEAAKAQPQLLRCPSRTAANCPLGWRDAGGEVGYVSAAA